MKYALVTGSTRGMGMEIAKELERNGYTVLGNGRSQGTDENYIQADLSNMEGVVTLCSQITGKNIRLDCLVLNAGTTCRKDWRDITEQDWLEVMNVNLTMPFFIVQKLYECLNDNASIVFISSELAIKPHATSIPYGVSKAGVNMLAQCLVKEVAGRGIRVNAICPGFIDTSWQIEKPKELRRRICDKVALGRFGQPKEVAKACVALCENTYINGAVITVDGGYDMK